MLAIFHKFETSKRPFAQRVRECCPLLRRKTDPVSQYCRSEVCVCVCVCVCVHTMHVVYIILVRALLPPPPPPQDRRDIREAEDLPEEETPDRYVQQCKHNIKTCARVL